MFSAQPFKHGRLGTLKLRHNQLSISTPCLFPVVSLITGTTARGGGLWKYILHADQKNGLLWRHQPLMSQVLHFVDFIPGRKHVLDKWRELGIKNRYTTEVLSDLQFNSPLFLDSGGFKLLWNKTVDLSAYGLSIENGAGPQSILSLQKDFGGDIIATLDYPLPPNLEHREAQDRMEKSLNNAIDAALQIQSNSQYKPFLYVATHGQDRKSIGRYVKKVFDRFQEEGLEDYLFGLAVGSLVPLRGGHKYSTIIELILGLQENIPEPIKNKIPIHVFGITGTLIPILAYLGVDSFDSSSYVQEARGLSYIDSTTGKSKSILVMNELNCNCRVCQHSNLSHIQETLTSNIRGIPDRHGNYKSKYYGDIALHNLEMDFKILEKTKNAIKADVLDTYLIEHINRHSNLLPALQHIAQNDDDLKSKISRVNISAFGRQLKDKKINDNGIKISLDRTPEDFDIFGIKYQPDADKKILLIIPCSGGKPYSDSHSHRKISRTLEQSLGDRSKLIQKVTLSGLYGPVPENYEREPAVMGYDFRLERHNHSQIALVTRRLVNYLKNYNSCYAACIGYATSIAYRTVLEQAAKEMSLLQVLPAKPKKRRLTEFFRQENLDELVERLDIALKNIE